MLENSEFKSKKRKNERRVKRGVRRSQYTSFSNEHCCILKHDIYFSLLYHFYAVIGLGRFHYGIVKCYVPYCSLHIELQCEWVTLSSNNSCTHIKHLKIGHKIKYQISNKETKTMRSIPFPWTISQIKTSKKEPVLHCNWHWIAVEYHNEFRLNRVIFTTILFCYIAFELISWYIITNL